MPIEFPKSPPRRLPPPKPGTTTEATPTRETTFGKGHKVRAYTRVGADGERVHVSAHTRSGVDPTPEERARENMMTAVAAAAAFTGFVWVFAGQLVALLIALVQLLIGIVVWMNAKVDHPRPAPSSNPRAMQQRRQPQRQRPRPVQQRPQQRRQPQRQRPRPVQQRPQQRPIRQKGR